MSTSVDIVPTSMLSLRPESGEPRPEDREHERGKLALAAIANASPTM
jgi:hypothetical protein